jgi:hypothetical protein
MRVLIILLALAGCYAPAISEISDSAVRVQYAVDNTSGVDAEAAKGCALYGKQSIRLSDRCASDNCYVREALYSCK